MQPAAVFAPGAKQAWMAKLTTGGVATEGMVGSIETIDIVYIVRLTIYTKPTHSFSLHKNKLPKTFKEFICYGTGQLDMVPNPNTGHTDQKMTDISRTIGWHDGETAHLFEVLATDGSVREYVKPVSEVKLHSRSSFRRRDEKETKRR